MTNSPTPRKIKPNPACTQCKGSGEIVDWVDYGSTVISMPSICDCVYEQLAHEGEEFVVDLEDWGPSVPVDWEP